MTARDKLKARIATLPTEALIEMSLMLADKLSTEEILVACIIETELCDRMPEAEFIAHCADLEAILDCAA